MKRIYISMLLAFSLSVAVAQEKVKIGADIPWTSYEAEKMKTTGTVLTPQYGPFLVEMESSGQQCVKLTAKDQFIEFKAAAIANAMVIRFSLPDNATGEKGTRATLGIYKNGKLVSQQKLSSKFCWLYGNYPFSNDPAAGKQRNFYEEARIKDLQIAKGDVIKLKFENSADDDASYCILDLVDLENIAAPLTAPANSLSVTDKSVTGFDPSEDISDALLRCITVATEQGKSVWIPAGTFKITRDINLPTNIKIQGAGMWHTTLVGDEKKYPENSSYRVRFRGDGSNIHISDFAIVGKLDYRDDSEPNDGIGGSFGTNSTVKRLWIEHTKAGIWVENSKNLVVEGCRFRNTIADGINYCVGMAESRIQNCTARGTGDDCFAMWPATFLKNIYKPGKNVISHCTAQLPFLANGAAIYGGESNRIEYCSFIDIAVGSAILISTTFPIEDELTHVNNHFSGTTTVESCTITGSGGYDHGWTWRGAVQVCLHNRDLSGLEFNNVTIDKSLSNAFDIISVNDKGNPNVLSNAVIKNSKITTYGIGAKDKHGLFVPANATGGLTIVNSTISETKNDSQKFTIK